MEKSILLTKNHNPAKKWITGTQSGLAGVVHVSFCTYVAINHMYTHVGTLVILHGRNLTSNLSIDNYWVEVYIANPIVRMKTQPRIF